MLQHNDNKYVFKNVVQLHTLILVLSPSGLLMW